MNEKPINAGTTKIQLVGASHKTTIPSFCVKYLNLKKSDELKFYLKDGGFYVTKE